MQNNSLPQQLNAILGLIIPLAYAAIGFYLFTNAASIGENGRISEGTAQVLGGIFFAYSLVKAYFAYRRWTRLKNEE